MVIKSLSSVGKWTILITTVYILYEKGILSLSNVFGIINYAKDKIKNITRRSDYPSGTEEVDIGNDYLRDMLPFDIYQSPQQQKPEIIIPNRGKPKIIIPKWGVWLIAKGSMSLKKSFPKVTETSDPDHPLWNPYNDRKLIKSILDDIDKL